MSELVEFKNTVAAHIKQNKIIDDVVEIIKKIPDYIKLKFDPEIIVYCCNIVENLIKIEDKKEINKLNLVTTILIKIWDIKEDNELDYIIKQIKYVVNNNQVKKVSKSKKYKKYIKDWIIRRLS